MSPRHGDVKPTASTGVNGKGDEMNTYEIDFDEFDFIMPPIAGGDGDGEGGEVTEQTAGEGAGGDTPGEESQDGQQVDEQQQQDEGQPQIGPDGQPIGQGGELDGGRAPQAVPYSRFAESRAEIRELRGLLTQALSQRQGGGPNGGGQAESKPREMPEQFRELDKGMGGYMRHYLDPLAQGLIQMQEEMRERLGDHSDQASFYRSAGRSLTAEQADMVERARTALTEKMGRSVERADALLFLRGHPTHGKLFVDQQAQQRQQLTNGVVAARRQAGKVGGSGPVARGRGTNEPVDLNKLPRSERIKVFEREMGNTPV